MKIALAHDFLVKYGGAEKVLLDLHHMFPDAPIYTLFYDSAMDKYFPGADIRYSSLQSQYKLLRNPKLMLPLMIKGAEELDFNEYDVVLSSSHSFIKGIITRPETCHICYCHTPMRWVWDTYHTYLDEQNLKGFLRSAVDRQLHEIRQWDKDSADRVDVWVANSNNVKNRIAKFYGKEARVIYPGVRVSQIKPSSVTSDYFLIVSRLSPYKRIDLAIKVFNKIGLPLVIIGTGDDEVRLKAMAKPNIEFLGFMSEDDKKEYLSHARALIFPGEDDFGLVPIEAQSAGRPVIAYGKGGALETVEDEMTGVLFYEPTPMSLLGALKKFFQMEHEFDSNVIRKSATRFSLSRFQKEIKNLITEVTGK